MKNRLISFRRIAPYKSVMRGWNIGKIRVLKTSFFLFIFIAIHVHGPQWLIITRSSLFQSRYDLKKIPLLDRIMRLLIKSMCNMQISLLEEKSGNERKIDNSTKKKKQRKIHRKPRYFNNDRTNWHDSVETEVMRMVNGRK